MIATKNISDIPILGAFQFIILLYFTVAEPDPQEAQNDTTCNLCNKTFKKNINLQLHMEKVHDLNSKPLVIEENIPETHKCPQCSREFVNEHALEKHIQDHETEKQNSKQNQNLVLKQEKVEKKSGE